MKFAFMLFMRAALSSCGWPKPFPETESREAIFLKALSYFKSIPFGYKKGVI